jgi:NTE family protein
MKKVGLVLSGGGVRGIAHIGVLKVLDQLNYKFSAISGCSIGALIGAFYSAGRAIYIGILNYHLTL